VSVPVDVDYLGSCAGGLIQDVFCRMSSVALSNAVVESPMTSFPGKTAYAPGSQAAAAAWPVFFLEKVFLGRTSGAAPPSEWRLWGRAVECRACWCSV